MIVLKLCRIFVYSIDIIDKELIMEDMKRNLHITPKQGRWQVKRSNASRTSGFFRTQKAAETQAKKWLRKSGGGEAVIHGRDGRIRDKDTIPPANDPNPPRDQVH